MGIGDWGLGIGDTGGCPSASAWGITRRFHRLSPSAGLVAYALRTRAPLSPRPKAKIPFDLHVLGLPLAFILSQDQTLHCIIVVLLISCFRAPLCLALLLFYLLLCFIVLASSFQRTFRSRPPFSQGRKRLQRYNLFSFPQVFFYFFFQKILIIFL